MATSFGSLDDSSSPRSCHGVPGAPAVNIFWHAQGVLALFPLGGTRYRVIADVGQSSGSIGEGHRPNPTVEEVQEILDVRGPGGIQASDPVWLSSFSINERKVSDYRSGRIFLAGDAAHVHSPAGGQGMNTGMQDACNLAWKLALVSRGICEPEPLLSSYSAERSAIAKLVLEATGKTTASAMATSSCSALRITPWCNRSLPCAGRRRQSLA